MPAGDPLPPVGMFTDARSINIDGADGISDTLLTTTTALAVQGATYLGASIRHPAGSRVVFDGAGSGDSVFALTGSITIAGDGSGSGPDVLVGTSATAYFDGTQTLSSLTVLPGGLARVQQDGTSVLTTYGLNLSPATTAMSGGILDVADNDVIVKASSTDTAVNAATLSTITGWLANGYDNGKWDDLASTSAPAPAAIVSVLAANNHWLVPSLGVAQVGGSFGLSPGLFDGQAVDAGDVAVAFTFAGDANLDGVSDQSTDYARVASDQGQTGVGWAGGDFNYDGVVDSADYGLWSSAAGRGWDVALPPIDDGSPYTLPLPADAVLSAGLATITGWTIRWGDGSVDSIQVASGEDPAMAVTHAYDGSSGAGMYTVAVSAVGVDGEGHAQTVDLPHEDLPVQLSAPAGLVATESLAGQLDLQWSAETVVSPGATITLTPSNGDPATVITTGPATYSYSVPGLTPGIDYAISVQAVVVLADGHSAPSADSDVIDAVPSGTSLSASGSESIVEGDQSHGLQLTAGAALAGFGIVSWHLVWTDGSGDTVATADADGSSANIPYPSPTAPYLTAFVTATDDSGQTFDLPDFSVDVAPTPISDLVAATASGAEVDLQWVNTSHIALGYNIYRSTDGGTTYGQIGTVGPDADTFADTTVQPGMQVLYVVSPSTAGGVEANPVPTAPTQIQRDAPAAVTAQPGTPGSGSAVVKWSYLGFISRISKFEIEAADLTAYKNFVLVGLDDPTPDPGTWSSFTYLVGQLKPSHLYKFRVRVDHSDGTVSDYGGTPQAQLAPDGLDFVSRSHGGGTWAELSFLFNHQDENVFTLEFYISQSPESNFSVAGLKGYNDSSIVISNLTANTQYYVKAVALSGGAASVVTATNFVTFDHDLAAPTGLSVIAANHSTTFGWTDNNADAGAFVQQLVADDRANSGGGLWTNFEVDAGRINYNESVAAANKWRARATAGAGSLNAYDAVWVSKDWSTETTSQSDDMEAPPSSPTATLLPWNQIKFSWTPDPNAVLGDVNSYQVMGWTTGGQPIAYAHFAATGNLVVVSNLLPSTKYYFTVHSFRVYGAAYGASQFKWGPESAVASVLSANSPFQPPPVTVATPDLIHAAWDPLLNTKDNHHATIYWHNSSDNENDFQLQRSTEPTFTDATKIVTWDFGADVTSYQDLTPDYRHDYYYRVRAGDGQVVSDLSAVAHLSPGPIIVMFYGADTILKFPNNGNQYLNEIEADLVSRGYQVQEFQADPGKLSPSDPFYEPITAAKQWLLQQLDTNGNGLYDPGASTSPNGPDTKRFIEIFGHSHGGMDVSYLANAIKNDSRFVYNRVYNAIALDPVGLFKFGAYGRIPDSVDNYYDFYQTNPKAVDGVPYILERINGIRVDSDAYFSLWVNVYADNTEWKDSQVMHLTIVKDLEATVERILEI